MYICTMNFVQYIQRYINGSVTGCKGMPMVNRLLHALLSVDVYKQHQSACMQTDILCMLAIKNASLERSKVPDRMRSRSEVQSCWTISYEVDLFWGRKLTHSAREHAKYTALRISTRSRVHVAVPFKPGRQLHESKWEIADLFAPCESEFWCAESLTRSRNIAQFAVHRHYSRIILGQRAAS